MSDEYELRVAKKKAGAERPRSKDDHFFQRDMFFDRKGDLQGPTESRPANMDDVQRFMDENFEPAYAAYDPNAWARAHEAEALREAARVQLIADMLNAVMTYLQSERFNEKVRPALVEGVVRLSQESRKQLQSLQSRKQRASLAVQRLAQNFLVVGRRIRGGQLRAQAILDFHSVPLVIEPARVAEVSESQQPTIMPEQEYTQKKELLAFLEAERLKLAKELENVRVVHAMPKMVLTASSPLQLTAGHEEGTDSLELKVLNEFIGIINKVPEK